MLAASGLSVAYGRRVILEHITFAIRRGEFWFCLGLNGAGKSTLLRAILGDLRPQSGQLWLHPDLASRQHLGFVPQRCDLNPALPTTVREFVLLGAVGIRLHRQERQARLEVALARVGLQQMARQSYWALSGGQRQRALVARALVRQPRLLLLDEPVSGFDLPTIDAFLQCLSSLHQREGATLLFVTHDVALAARYATHVMLLRAGSMVAGPAQEVLTPHCLTHVYGVGIDVSRDAAGGITVNVAMPGGPL
ncbi:MAG TPA: ABC transporter ATP-binding protein [Candidatus Tectomicrobia bacterium]